MSESLIISLDSQVDSLEIVGGKGRSLAKLTNAGFDVPGGFQITTQAYRQFVAEHNLQSQILELAKPRIVEGTSSFEQASRDIVSLFHEHALNEEITQQIVKAYEALEGTPAVAVRSSANAEDLPDLSFAGQQETYLNVTGANEVAAAVRNCWASLWTAQAINYRHEMDIRQDVVAMAVVVQIMIPSEVSGILFTANPATGDRDEMIVNCSFGLGEAVVSGQVTPDTYVVDRQSLKTKETIIGAKDQMIVSDGNQGTRMEDVTEAQKKQSSLAETALNELASVALQIEKKFDGVPQDIEWAISAGKLWLLQSRPITQRAF
jgi:phosphoenolpyruvate synthase/pyruvate phosphate dikinase